MAEACILCGEDVGWRGSYGAQVNNRVLHPLCLKCKERCSVNPQQIIDSRPHLFEKPEPPASQTMTAPSVGGTATATALQPVSFEREQALLRRYADAYLVARTTVGVGGTVKGIGVVLAMMLLFGTFMAAMELRNDAITVLACGIFFSIVIGLFLYAIGTLIAAQGQIIQATLDGAVNSSPFLTNDLRARIMSI